MTGNQIKRILTGMGISSFENIKLPQIYRFIMSQNFYVEPETHSFTFDFTNELMKVKKLVKVKKENGTYEFKNKTSHLYDAIFDLNNIVGIEIPTNKMRV